MHCTRSLRWSVEFTRFFTTWTYSYNPLPRCPSICWSDIGTSNLILFVRWKSCLRTKLLTNSISVPFVSFIPATSANNMFSMWISMNSGINVFDSFECPISNFFSVIVYLSPNTFLVFYFLLFLNWIWIFVSSKLFSP